MDLEPALWAILKRYDRIGFGRRGVLDAEQEIRRFAAGLSSPQREELDQMVCAWIVPAEAERLTAALHYNLPEHVQALALRLCASLPITEALPMLLGLQRAGAFPEDQQLCRTALEESIAALTKI